MLFWGDSVCTTGNGRSSKETISKDCGTVWGQSGPHLLHSVRSSFCSLKWSLHVHCWVFLWRGICQYNIEVFFNYSNIERYGMVSQWRTWRVQIRSTLHCCSLSFHFLCCWYLRLLVLIVACRANVKKVLLVLLQTLHACLATEVLTANALGFNRSLWLW